MQVIDFAFFHICGKISLTKILDVVLCTEKTQLRPAEFLCFTPRDLELAQSLVDRYVIIGLRLLEPELGLAKLREIVVLSVPAVLLDDG